MATTTFIDKQTVVTTDWLNDIDNLGYQLLGYETLAAGIVDGQFLVADGISFVLESGETAGTSLGALIGDLVTLGASTADSEMIVATGAGTLAWESGETLGTSIGAAIGDLVTLGAAAADGEFIVATGAGAFAYESGATVRTSLGLGTAAVENVGVANGNVPQMDAIGYPAADGSQITGVTSTPGANSVGATELVNAYAKGWQWISTSSPSAVATLDLVLSATYEMFKIYFVDMLPATDDVGFACRLSTDGGTSFHSAATDYSWTATGVLNDTTNISHGDAADSEIQIVTDLSGASTKVGNAAAEGCSGEILIMNPHATASHTAIMYRVNYRDNTTQHGHLEGGGSYETAGATDAIQLLFNSGNISSGTVYLFGLDIDA